jgi:hypothetical protein
VRLRNVHERALNFTGKIDKNKILSWIKVIFAFVIDDSQVLGFCGTVVGQYLIDHPGGKQIRIVRLDTNR